MKKNGRGGEIARLLFCQFLKYLARYMLHFITYSAKIPAKILCFYDFLAKN